MHIVAIVAAMILAACRLGPQVPDEPGASTHLLPKNAVVPLIENDLELSNQIRVNDGVNDDPLMPNKDVIPLGTGQSDGAAVHFWSLGAATRAPAPLFELFRSDGTRIDHPGLVYTIPGDRGYNPLHSLHRVVVTDAYDGEQITTAEALADAIELGLVEEPRPTQQFVTLPIALATTALQTGDPGNPTLRRPEKLLYARGYAVSAFRFGGELGVQPVVGFLPTLQVSFLRGDNEGPYNPARPIFQAKIPTPPVPLPPMPASYTALSTVVNVNVTGASTDIVGDDQLFGRNATGDITSTKDAVVSFEITGVTLVLQLALPGGDP